jgi:succinate dehydrogenase flavin-adding protein (antitoxin of CptAB toxin-antitoxin module)
MTKEQFIAAGQAAFGQHFVTEFSQLLNVTDRTVRRWVNGTYPIPDSIMSEIIGILIARSNEIDKTIAELQKS